MSFGWSVGDIAQAIKALHSLVSALDSVSGAAHNYREAVSFLNDLANVLTPLQRSDAIKANTDIENAISEQVKAIKGPVDDFLKIAGKYEKSLGSAAARGHFRNVPRKLQWHYSTSTQVKALQGKIERHMQILDTLFQRLTTGLICELPSELRIMFNDVLDARLASTLQRSLQPLEASITAQWTALAQGPEALARYLQDHRILSSIALETLLDTVQKKQIACLQSRALQDSEHTTSISSEIDDHQRREGISPNKPPDNTKSQTIHLAARYLDKWNYRLEDIRVSQGVISRLNEWWLSESSLLWIQESPYDQANRPSQISAAISAQTIDLGVPAGVFSCRCDVNQLVQGISYKQRLLELLHGLSTIIESCYPSLKETASQMESISQTQPLAKQDISRGAIDAGINRLQRQIGRLDGTLVLLIDGINIIDYSGEKEVEDGLEKLLKLLYHVRSHSSVARLRTLLTTPGQTLFLLDRIEFEDKISAADTCFGDYEGLLARMRREAKST